MKRFQIISPEQSKLPDAKWIVVLGRGLTDTGELTETGFERVKLARSLAQLLLHKPDVIMYCGGSSWVQALEGTSLRKESDAMLAYARSLSADTLPPGVEERAEIGGSISTVENLVNAKVELGMQPGEPYIIVTDGLHNACRRIEYTAGKVSPDSNAYLVYAANPDVPIRSVVKEMATTVLTRIYLGNAAAGDDDAIMAQQRLLQNAVAEHSVIPATMAQLVTLGRTALTASW